MIRIIEDLIDDYINNPKPISEYPSIKLPKYVYHGTTYDKLDSIAETGLGVSSSTGVYDGVHKIKDFSLIQIILSHMSTYQEVERFLLRM